MEYSYRFRIYPPERDEEINQLFKTHLTDFPKRIIPDEQYLTYPIK